MFPRTFKSWTDTIKDGGLYYGYYYFQYPKDITNIAKAYSGVYNNIYISNHVLDGLRLCNITGPDSYEEYEIDIKSGFHTFSYIYNSDNDTCTIYIDGKLIGTKNEERRAMNWMFTFGMSNPILKKYTKSTGNQFYFEVEYNNYKNSIDLYSARVYNKALSDIEIKENYNTDYTRFVEQSSST